MQELNTLSDEWRQERLLATDSLNKSIWRLADAYDKIEEGKEKIRSNIERVSDRAASNSGSVATDVGSGLIAGLRDGLKSLEDQRITSHKDDFNTIYSSVQFYSNDGDIKTLSHPLCAMQLYSGISFNIEPGQSVPGCLGIIQNKSALASKWKRLCSSFVHSYSANENVGQWLNSILASGQQASRVHRIVEKSNIGLTSADAALGGIEKLYGSKVASDIGTLVGAKRLDQHSTDRVDYNSERTEFISMLESDRSLTTTEKLRLINQYDRKFGEG
ncbi:hypothetical protein I3271_03360 [Photobacterium leiognathi]|uniref:hypothetical protein n=1 Tax=Photobacterium leiognathi TaxID=553611 RepID=UPI001EDD96E7|nr:hypothetical protein [Photobacterium leiognathi]MCG3883719.1 hypothetical protein [Photobacterium leiognathi]